MDLHKLKSLISVAEMNGISAASNALNLTQSAVSQQLKELERQLGMELIDRSRRPVSLTNKGAELVTVAREMIKQWEDFQDHHQKTEFEGQLVLGYIRSAVTSILARAFLLLRKKYPQVAIRLVNTGGVSKHIAKLVADGEIDAGLGVGPLPLPKGVVWRPISLERYYLVAPAHYRGKTDEELLHQGPYLRFKPYLLSETIIDREMKRRGIRVEAVMELDDYDSILLMAEHDLGVGIVPEPYITRRYLEEFHCVPFGTPPLTREGGIMVRYDNPSKNLVDLLWKTLKNFYTRQLIEKRGKEPGPVGRRQRKQRR
jgi:DNA-binding transcriptional LysR family regulator